MPNRTLLKDRLTHLSQQARRAGDTNFGLLVLDLDDFKTVNDTLGHTIGDKLLKSAGERITARLRQSDTVARIGGDEFAIIVEQLHKADEAVNVASKLLEEFATPFQIEDHEIFTSLSIGITTFPDDGSNADDLLRNADTAMYWAKDAGKNRYQFFLREMNERITQRLDLENAMRKAIERNEFLLHYQPQIELATGRVIGMEALIRWNRPEVGLVSPFHFIPVAEDSGLITPIGEWVLRTACHQNMAWREAGLGDLRVSVNLSGRQFKQTDLPKLVADVLRESGLPARYLELEITESVAMEHAEKTVEVLREFSAMGVKIAIDDFGTGYSSLGYLKRFPIDTLKVDRSFVKDITDDPDDAAITSATIAMAHSLKLHVIAEGAETADQIAMLKDYGCDVVQGYFYAKPMPVAEFAKFVEAKRATQPSVGA